MIKKLGLICSLFICGCQGNLSKPDPIEDDVVGIVKTDNTVPLNDLSQFLSIQIVAVKNGFGTFDIIEKGQNGYVVSKYGKGAYEGNIIFIGNDYAGHEYRITVKRFK